MVGSREWLIIAVAVEDKDTVATVEEDNDGGSAFKDGSSGQRWQRRRQQKRRTKTRRLWRRRMILVAARQEMGALTMLPKEEGRQHSCVGMVIVP